MQQKFKIGDKVKVLTRAYPGACGTEGVITKFGMENVCRVERNAVNYPSDQYGCFDRDSWRYCFCEEDLELVTDQEVSNTEPDYVIGQVQQKEREVAAEKAKVQKQHQIALLRAKYTPDDAESSEWTIREKILSQDKYLRLAYYLEQNRNDWNDGCDYAETGLNGFTIETTQDQEIYDSIQALIDDWDGDGRCFRDCAWGYGELYGLVENQQLLDDLEQLKGG